MGATVVLMGTPSLENTAATAVLKMPRLLRSISTCSRPRSVSILANASCVLQCALHGRQSMVGWVQSPHHENFKVHVSRLSVCPVTGMHICQGLSSRAGKTESNSWHLKVFLLQAAKALLVIARALVRIAEDAIGCGHLPELPGRCLRLRALILVRVISKRQLAICAATSDTGT